MGENRSNRDGPCIKRDAAVGHKHGGICSMVWIPSYDVVSGNVKKLGVFLFKTDAGTVHDNRTVHRLNFPQFTRNTFFCPSTIVP